MEMNNIRTVVVNDNAYECADIVKQLSGEDRIAVVDIAKNGEESLAMVQKFHPDVLVLDMLMPGMDGHAVIDALSEMKLAHLPGIVLISFCGLSTDIINQYDGFRIDVLNRPILPERLISSVITVSQVNSPLPQNFNVDLSKVKSILDSVGLPLGTKGYEFIVSAVTMLVHDDRMLLDFSKMLYPLLATKYETSAVLVERAIRYAIEVAWNRGDVEAQHKIFAYTIDMYKGKPTNKEFLARIAEALK